MARVGYFSNRTRISIGIRERNGLSGHGGRAHGRTHDRITGYLHGLGDGHTILHGLADHHVQVDHISGYLREVRDLVTGHPEGLNKVREGPGVGEGGV